MNHPTLRKDFDLQAEWTPDQARAVTDFLTRVTDSMPLLRTGSYVGTGRENEVQLSDMPAPPALLMLQAESGGTIFLTLVPALGTEVTAWSRKSFTVAAGAAHNAANTAYRFLILT